MAFGEFENAMVEVKMDAYMESARPPLHIRPQLDLGYRIEDQSVILFEIRPHFRTEERMKIDYAKARWSKTDKHWKVYWHRADGKWHRYEPVQSVERIEDFLQTVDDDEHVCFKG